MFERLQCLGCLVPIVLMTCTWSIRAASEEVDLLNLDDWRIVVADDAAASVKYAAEEFGRFFAEATGVDLTVHGDAQEQHNIFIGPSAALRASDLAFVLDAEYQPEEIRLVVRADNIAIVGGQPRGVLYGVYEFLESLVGVRFLTKDHIYVPDLRADPERAKLREMDYRYKPPLNYRLLYYGELLFNPIPAARMRMNAVGPNLKLDPEIEQKVGAFARGGLIIHSISGWLDVPFAEHPDYYALWKGKRNNRQPCMSHPDVLRIITENMLKRAGHWSPNAVIALAQQDAGPRCQGERCQQIMDEHGGGHSAVVLRMVNHVAREIRKVRPDVKIGTLAYAWSRQPPTGMTAEPNVRVQYATYHTCLKHGFGHPTCPQNLVAWQQMRGWAEICDDLIYWHYMVNFKDYLLPPVNMDSIASQVRGFVDNNATSIFFQGPGGGRNAPFADLMMYVLTRLAWNPQLSDATLTSEFLDLHYGSAAPPIREFLARVNEAVRMHWFHENCNGPMSAYGLTPELGRQGIELFDEAWRRAESQAQRDRVEKASVCAYRMALGDVWYGTPPAELSDEQAVEYRRLTRRIFELSEKHNVNEHREGTPIKRAAANVRKALGMGEGEAF